MRLNEEGEPAYVGERKAGIAGWFGESIELVTEFDLCPAHETSGLSRLAPPRI